VSGDFRPASVDFRAPRADEEPELVRWNSDGGGQSGTLADVAGYYLSLERGRMVVLGEPGAGKTVLATQLVIDLTQALPEGDLQPGDRPPVPVWLSLPSLDLGETSSVAGITAEQAAVLLDRWMAAQIAAVHQIPIAVAAQLVNERWVLPVLDGLDEMDTAGASTPGSARPRAAAVVRALNSGTGRRPVILVCRRGEYGELASSVGPGTEDPVLQAATQIILQPLDVPRDLRLPDPTFPRQPGR
jgi:predicted NACHT family NTPase